MLSPASWAADVVPACHTLWLPAWLKYSVHTSSSASPPSPRRRRLRAAWCPFSGPGCRGKRSGEPRSPTTGTLVEMLLLRSKYLLEEGTTPDLYLTWRVVSDTYYEDTIHAALNGHYVALRNSITLFDDISTGRLMGLNDTNDKLTTCAHLYTHHFTFSCCVSTKEDLTFDFLVALRLERHTK